jgi:hypothetical protein
MHASHKSVHHFLWYILVLFSYFFNRKIKKHLFLTTFLLLHFLIFYFFLELLSLSALMCQHL